MRRGPDQGVVVVVMMMLSWQAALIRIEVARRALISPVSPGPKKPGKSRVDGR